MSLYPLTQTALILKNNVSKLMKGISANTLEVSCNAFVDISGKVIATFPQLWIGPDELLISVASSVTEEVEQHISKYGRLSKTAIERPLWNVYIDCQGDYPLQEGEHLCSYLGFSIIFSENEYAKQMSEEEFVSWRLKNTFPLHGVDYHNEMLLNVDPERYISFEKGCFLGQEVLARVHHKSKPPRQLKVMPVADVPEERRFQMTSLGTMNSDGEVYGFIFMKH